MASKDTYLITKLQASVTALLEEIQTQSFCMLSFKDFFFKMLYSGTCG